MAEENKNNEPSQQQPIDIQPLPRFYGQYPGSCNSSVRKMEWPELVGLKAEEAEKRIKEEMPGAQIQVVQPDHFVTMDYRQHRVRLYVDSSGNIQRAPRIG